MSGPSGITCSGVKLTSVSRVTLDVLMWCLPATRIFERRRRRRLPPKPLVHAQPSLTRKPEPDKINKSLPVDFPGAEPLIRSYYRLCFVICLHNNISIIYLSINLLTFTLLPYCLLPLYLFIDLYLPITFTLSL